MKTRELFEATSNSELINSIKKQARVNKNYGDNHFNYYNRAFGVTGQLGILQYIIQLQLRGGLDSEAKQKLKNSLVKFTLQWLKTSSVDYSDLIKWLRKLHLYGFKYPELELIRQSIKTENR